MNDSMAKLGSEGRVTHLVDVRHPEHVFIGRGSYVNGGMLATSKIASITIGRDCMISYNVHMRTDSHKHDRADVPMNRQGHVEADIVIGDDAWIGYGTQVMDGVAVGSHSIIGAGAFVTHDVPEYAVAIGVPARAIKDRREG